jgi:hypothetical protein
MKYFLCYSFPSLYTTNKNNFKKIKGRIFLNKYWKKIECKCKCMIKSKWYEIDKHIRPKGGESNYAYISWCNKCFTHDSFLKSITSTTIRAFIEHLNVLLSKILPLQSSLPLHSTVKTYQQQQKNNNVSSKWTKKKPQKW